MATKYEQLTALYLETVKKISRDEEAWMDFLKSSCRNYRLSFSDMVLIYAQRPETKAVLEMEAWNKRYGLWIKQGSKGIAVFDPDHSSARIKYYFDIADTRKTKFYRPVPIWSMKSEYEQEVIHALNDKFGILDSDITLEEAILSASANIVEDNISDYLTDLNYCKADSLLEELDEQNLEIIYKSVLINSIAYSVLTRCDIDAQLYINEDDLKLISQFNTPELLNALGVTSRDMTQMVLGEVRTAVLNCIRQSNRTFELQGTNLYNKTERKEKSEERSLKQDEDRIYSAGRLSNSQLDTQTRGQYPAWEIRIDEEKIPQGTSTNTVHQLFNNADTQSAFDGNRQDSQSEERNTDETADGTAESQRTVEGSQSNAMDTDDEQYRGNSSRDHLQGTDLQLNQNENIIDITKAGQFEIPAFFTHDEFDAIFKFDRFNKRKNKDVQKIFQLFDDLDRRIAYLKESYKDSIIELLYHDVRLGFRPDEEKNALRVWKGSYSNTDDIAYISWENAVHYIDDMINRNVYVPIPSKPVPTVNEQQLNLFDMGPIELSQNKDEAVPYSLPQYMIDAVLLDGINTYDKDFKIEVTNFMSLDRPLDECAEYLKTLYGQGMNGFIINNRQISYRWNEAGIELAFGDGIVNAFEKQLLKWNDIAKGIRQLLDDGRYISEDDLKRCQEVEYKNAADMLWYMYQDTDHEKCDHLSLIKDYYRKGFPNGTQAIMEKLNDHDFYDQIMTELNEFKDDFLIDSDIMRFKRQYNPLKVIPVIERLTMPHIHFSGIHYKEEKLHYFMTQDKIDSIITDRDGDVKKYGIYSFFLNHSDKKERIKFLKKSWGLSGSNDYSSDGKGLRIMYGYSNNHPNVEVTLKWKDVEKRIDYLITHNKYLDEKGTAGLEDYESGKIADDISFFFVRLPFSNIRPFNPHNYYWDGRKEILEIIKDRENLPHIIDVMQIALDNTAQTDENYQDMVGRLKNVRAYYQGTFTLFNQKKVPIHDEEYVANMDVYSSLAVRLDEYMEDHDYYDYHDNDDGNNIDNIIATLHDRSGLGDLIKYLNANIVQDENKETIATARMLREELSTLYAMQLGSQLNETFDFEYSYGKYISQEKPIYNTGDFVFLYQRNEPIFGTIELIENDKITIHLYDIDIQGESFPEEIELDKEEFEEILVKDYRNAYLYDQSRELLRPPHQIEEDNEEIMFEDTFSYKNFMLLDRIAPLITHGESSYMEFVNDDDDTLVIALDNNRLKIAENPYNGDQPIRELSFVIDTFETTLDIREARVDDETYSVPLVSDEVDDYEIELQMNEQAHEFMTSIFDKKYYLQSFEVNGLGKTMNVRYSYDGNISYFSGNDQEYEAFIKHYGNDPIKNISSLVPLNEGGKDNIQRTEQKDIASENYKLLQKIAPLIISGESDYMRFVAGEHMMPLTIEVIDEYRIAMSHHYELNGDMMADPDMEFMIDIDNERLNARTYQQDNLMIYQEIELNNNEVINTDLEKQLNDFTNQWLNNIINNGYILEKMTYYSTHDLINISYGEDGFISEFSGSDEDLDYFREQYDEDAQNRISILVADHDDEQIIDDLPAQKENDFSDEPVQPDIEYVSNHIADQVLFPEVQEENRHDFHITDYDLGTGDAKEKYRANIKAIRMLKTLESEKRLASPDEQEILSHYVGWGGLPDVFDETKENWKNEYAELKALLNDKEYRAARESTLTAFYTPPIIIESIYKKLIDLGFTSGNVLEPSCGVGNFMGMKPNDLDCHFYGIEIDEISGRIARQLYQNSRIAIQGFEKTDLSDNFFDAVIGNVPYGQLPVHDPRYNQQHFMIHDYFFAKALDKVKIGGIVIFLTSKFTMDKKTNDVRKYIAQRAKLLGAVRLPDNTFQANAGTRVTTDILILQKLEKPLEQEPEWIDIGINEDGIIMNSYFIEHPEMILGTMVEETSRYGMATACKEKDDEDLKELLENAMNHVHGEMDTSSVLFADEEDQSIPADPQIRNFSYCIHDGLIYYRENSRMYPMELSKTAENRVRGMIAIRDSLRTLIELQTNDYPEKNIRSEQNHLDRLYDDYVSKYGLISSRGSRLAFQDDSSYSLICSLEILNNDGTLKRKADIFTKRTIKPRKPVQSVDTASEALTVCMAEKGRIDFDFMTQISHIPYDELIEKLQGVIFPNPIRLDSDGNYIYETSDEYLSGDVREKLSIAKKYAKNNTLFDENVKALKQVQPERIKAGDISVRLGTTWIPPEVYNDFIYELLDTPIWRQSYIKALYVSSTQEWNITHKSMDGSIKATKTYGTHRVNAYKIIESTLNLRDVKIFDKETDDDGKEIRVLNKKETAIAQSKQDLIKSKFVEWVWSDPERREMLCDIYNEKFNSIRNRTYDGSHLKFYGMNPDITLKKHQVDAVARILYGGNTLLAHCVGAGKTFEMIAAGMESRRLGFCTKPLYVVPNNIIGDFASDFYRLYPSANILVATTDTLSKANRHKFFSRIASGDWDGVIITHSQFIKMPISIERQIATIDRQVEEISNNIQSLKENNGERFTVKQLESMKKKLETRLEKLNDQSKKDDILCFEQLGIDMLFVDEADLFKNLFLYSKMSNVSGISQRDSQRASDLFMKTQYLDELTNYRGVVFATGTPVSNSMAVRP